MSQMRPAEGGYLDRRQWLLGIGLGLLGLITWWQLQRLAPDQPPPRPFARYPDYQVRGFVAVETDAQGQLRRRLQARELRYYAAEDLAELDEPRLLLYRPDGSAWEARAQLGLVRANGDEIQLRGAVRLDRDPSRHDRPLHLETEQLVIWRQQGLAEAPLPVRLESSGDLLTAQGMRLWYLEERLHTQFRGRARALLRPPTDPNQP